jgi:hypothetical protein
MFGGYLFRPSPESLLNRSSPWLVVYRLGKP